MSNPETTKYRARTRGIAWIAMGAAFLALAISLLSSGTTLNNRGDLLDIKAGRKVSAMSNCGFQQSVIDAGRAALSNVLLPGDEVDKDGKFHPGKLSRFLGDSFPSYPERLAGAVVASQRYTKKLLDAVRRGFEEAGIPPPFDKKGNLDCKLLVERIGA